MESQPALKPLSILVIEDEPAQRRGLELSLGHLGHLVISASRADQVSAMLKGFLVDLVICDHRLPDGTSEDVMHAIRANAPRTPAIVLSGQMGQQEQSQAVSDGFVACLEKPLDPGRLQRAVCQAIGRPL